MELVPVVPGQPFLPPPEDISWSALLAFPIPHIATPAWTRPRKSKLAPKVLTTFEIVAPSQLPAEFVRSRHPRLRLNTHTPTQGVIEFCGVPLTKAELARLTLEAHLDVAGHYCSNPTLLHHPLEFRPGAPLPWAPYKRLEDGRRIAPTHLEPNWFDFVMDELFQLLKSGGIPEALSNKQTVVAHWVMMERSFRRVRPRLIDLGQPDLDDITDLSEPESPRVIKAPVIKFESFSSLKRVEKLNKSTVPRIADNFVMLPPVAPAQPSPSPTKSASPPSTPMGSPRQSSSATPNVGSSDLSKSFLTATEHLSPPGPTRVFRVPSETDSSLESIGEHPTVGQDSTIPPVSSPVKRPVAPTPSRMRRPEPSTPQVSTSNPNVFTPMAATPSPFTPGALKSIAGIGPLATFTKPHLESLQTPNNTPAVKFGESSVFKFSVTSAPSVPYVSLVDSVFERPRPRNTDRAHRRRSEPLFRDYLKMQARRHSELPRNLTHSDDTFRHEMSTQVGPLPSAASVPSTPTPAGTTTVDEPIPTVNIQTSTPSGTSERFSNNDTTVVESAANGHSASNEHPNVDIDVRENPDIFGGIRQLAQIAETNCAGQANVQLAHENGRFVVRFKLPTEYAWMFPESQGFDQSQFSSPPSISSSPRIRVPVQQPSLPLENDSVVASDPVMANDSAVTREESDDQSNSGLSISMPHHSVSFQTPTILGHRIFSAGAPTTQTPTQSTAQEQQDQGSHVTLSSHTPRLAAPTAAGGDSSRLMPSDTPRANAMEDRTFNIAELGIDDFSVAGSVRTPRFAPPATHGGDRTLNISELGIEDFSVAGSAHTPRFATPTGHGDQTLNIAELGLEDFSPVGNAQTPCPNARSDGIPSLLPQEETPVVRTPEVSQLDTESTNFPSLTSSAQPLSPLEPTPKGAEIPGVTDNEMQMASNISPVPHTPLPHEIGNNPTQAPMPATGSSVLPAVDGEATPLQQAAATPTDGASGLSPKPSFTPVNQTTPENEAAVAHEWAAPTGMSTPSGVTAATTQVQDDDSPGREFMRDFIKRSRPKRTSTTETGSPIAPPTKRLPLGAKSPNAASPQKTKRKLNDDVDVVTSLVKEPVEPAPKRAKRATKSSRQKSDLEINMNDNPSTAPTATQATEVEKVGRTVGEQDSGPVTRRSSRLRNKETTSAAKSSIPTSIKLGRPASGRAGGVTLNATVRKEQQNLARETSTNTERNKFKTGFPKQVLARQAELQESEMDAPAGPSVAKSNKSVAWRSPLESVRSIQTVEDEAPEETLAPTAAPKSTKSSSRAAPKSRTTLGKTGIAKPKASSAKRARAPKKGANPGVADGTPPRPQRITRARAQTKS